MALMKVRDTELNVDIVEGRSANDMVFIHGNLASNIWWQPMLENWTETGSGRMVFIEWRGNGKSAAPKSKNELRMENLALDVLEVVKELKLVKPHAVAHSTGGLILLNAVMNAPEKFNKIFLLDSVAEKGVVLPEDIFALYEKIRFDRQLCSDVMAMTIGDIDRESPLFQGIVDDTLKVADVNWTGVLQVLGNCDYSEGLARILNPVMVAHGENDQILPLSESKRMSELLPNGHFRILKNAGHSMNVQMPRQFVGELNSFFNA